MDTSVVISSCSLAEARHLLGHFLKASIEKVSYHTAAHVAVLIFIDNKAAHHTALPSPCTLEVLDELVPDTSTKCC